MSVINIYENNFATEVLNSKKPVIVDFWAPWCTPCRMMAPVFEELSEELDGKLKFAKVNTEEEQELAQKNMIQSIPCLIMFKNGREAGRIIGLLPKNALKDKINSLLR